MADIRSTPTDEPAFRKSRFLYPLPLPKAKDRPLTLAEQEKLAEMIERAEEYRRAEARRYYGPVLPEGVPGADNRKHRGDEGPKGPYR